MLGTVRRSALWLLVLCLLPRTSFAESTAPFSVSRFALASWSERDGLSPAIVNAIAQDRAGYLWLGTDGGLIRFDGVRFTPFDALRGSAGGSAAVSALASGRDGSLWIGFLGAGGVARLHEGSLTFFDTSDGLQEGALLTLLEDREGTVWAGSLRGLARFRQGQWERIGPAAGLPEERIDGAYEDRAGRLWIASAAGPFVRQPGADRFTRVSSEFRARSFAEGPDGTVWATTADQGLVRLGARSSSMAGMNGFDMIADRAGNFWVATRTSGISSIAYMHWDGRSIRNIERLSQRHGLIGDLVLSFLEDREGNIWVGTDRGLTRISSSTVTAFHGPDEVMVGQPVRAIAADSKNIWIGSTNGLFRVSGTGITRLDLRAGVLSPLVHALHLDRRGDLWVATERGVGLLNNEIYTPLQLGSVRFDSLKAIAIDKGGDLWLSDLSAGVFRTATSAPRFTTVTRKIGLAAHTDSRGWVWVGCGDGTLMCYRPDGARTYTRQHGLRGDRVAAVYEDRKGRIWIGTNGGLSRLEGERFVTAGARTGLPLDNVTGILEDDRGNLWLGVGTGILRISHQEFERAAADQSVRPEHTLYGVNDGLPGTPRTLGYPTAARANDGTLWFVTNNGLAVVDPSRPRRNTAPPPVVIEGVVSNGRQLTPSLDHALPARSSGLQIDYTGLSFTAPSEVRFRYHLDGFDTDWIDAGTRRQAFYTNLPPRDYRFQVMATADGTWSGSPATWSFSIAPAFYQTAWFYGLCGTLVAFAIGGVWRLRVVQLRNRMAVVLQERTRIGRELHDTLLQSLVGVGMQCDDVLRKFESSPATARDQLAQLRRQVKFYAREARQSVWDLRTPLLESGDLQAVLQEVGERITADQPVRFAFAVSGTPRALASKRKQEHLLRIGQEAITNAVRHAQATTIRMEVSYDCDRLTLHVVDDGQGFDIAEVDSARANHWGLSSMRERAQQIGAEFSLRSQPGSGTSIEIVTRLDLANAGTAS